MFSGFRVSGWCEVWLQVSALGHSRAACFDRYYASRIEAGLRVFRAFLRHFRFRGCVFSGFRAAGFGVRGCGLQVCGLQGCRPSLLRGLCTSGLCGCTFQAPASDLQAFVGLQAQTSEVANSFTWIK